MGIIIKNTLINAYYSINMVEHYYESLQQVYLIIITKILNIEPE